MLSYGMNPFVYVPMKRTSKSFAILITALVFSLFGSRHAQAQDCIDPSLIDPTAFCPFIYDPVCGCNFVTYSNSCLAQVTDGVTSWTSGPCSNGDNIPPSLNVPDDLTVECGDDFEFAVADSKRQQRLRNIDGNNRNHFRSLRRNGELHPQFHGH